MPQNLTIKINPLIQDLEGYVPGDQPADPDIVKLNTNESPWPTSPRVLKALHDLDDDSVRKYPDPVCRRLRKQIGERLKFKPNEMIIGNGSDEILRMICHAFAAAGDTVGMLNPTYSLYPILCDMYGLKVKTFDVEFNGDLKEEIDLSECSIFFLANPNPPYGTFYSQEWVSEIIEKFPECLIVIDEAYVDFAPNDGLDLVRKHTNVLVSRTFSKSASLAGLRVGYGVSNVELIEVMNRIRDSYNVNALSQMAAGHAVLDNQYYTTCAEKIILERERVREGLLNLDFEVEPSFGNFVFARCENAQQIFEKLRANKIFVRYFSQEPLNQGMRVTIGTPAQNNRLLEALKEITGDN